MVNSLILAHSHEHYRFSDKALKLIRQPQPPVHEEVLDVFSRAQRSSPQALYEKAVVAAEQTVAYMQKHASIRWISRWHEGYPQKLLNIAKPPWGLFYVGTLPDMTESTLAVVGTRRPNLYGREVLQRFLPELKVPGLQIISGLALGIDGLAHEISCSQGVKNFAVLGNGLPQIYPQDHSLLARKILNTGGGIISEFPLGTPAHFFNFPHRNRIISALADVVWIVQGTRRSGSGVTGRAAMEQGKTVCVTPGDIFSELSETPYALLHDGAQPIVSVKDLCDVLYLHK